MRTRIIKALAILTAIVTLTQMSTCPVQAAEADIENEIDWEGQGFVTMHTTAYCLHGVTANGGYTRPYTAACNPHLGDVAIVYTMDGQFLGMYEITDTGSTNGLQSGRVIDVWRVDYTQCESWMKLTRGKVRVKWIEGEG